jgi:hypothetical protein
VVQFHLFATRLNFKGPFHSIAIMKEQLEPIVIHAEALHGGDVLLTFADSSCAVFSARLLRSMLHLTERFLDKDLEEIQHFSIPRFNTSLD